MMSVVEEKNQTEKRKASKAKDVESVKIQPSVNNTTFIDWWNYKYQTVPSNVEGEYVQGKYADRYKKTPYKYNYISNYDIDTLIKYYKIYEIAHWNGEIGTLRGHKYDDLAEKTNMHKNFYEELGSYMAFQYLDYLETITKEWFSAHKELGIEPDYYSSITSTAYVGFLTFDCDIIVNKPKDDPNFEDEIQKKLQFLENTLPDMIRGFRVLDIKYVNEVSGTSGFLGRGYIWRKNDGVLLNMDKSGHGSRGWGTEKSWNNGQKIESYYTID